MSVCQNPKCPHGNPELKRGKRALYCSRECTVSAAHQRADARQRERVEANVRILNPTVRIAAPDEMGRLRIMAGDAS